jgi:hypothetical protein
LPISTAAGEREAIVLAIDSALASTFSGSSRKSKMPHS